MERGIDYLDGHGSIAHDASPPVGCGTSIVSAPVGQNLRHTPHPTHRAVSTS
jgi:hypothetical protein